MKKWPVIRGAAVIGTALVEAVTPAQAQQASAGPFWQLSFTLEDRYDDNIARTGRARAAARGLTLGDARTTPGILFTIERPLGRNMLSLNASAGYDFYRRNTRLNRERISVGARASLNAAGCNLVLAPTFARRQSDLGDIQILSVPGVDSVRNVETIQNYSAELSCGEQNYGIRPLVTGSRSIGDNSTAFRRISDYRSWRYGSGIGYNSPTLGDFTARVTRTETEYPGRSVAFGRRSFNTNRGELTARREIGALLTASGSISYISLDPNGGAERFRGLGWNLALAAVPQPALRVTAGLSRDVSPSLGTDALYQVSQSYSLGTTYAMSRLISVGLSGGLDRRRFVGATSVFGPALTNSSQRTYVATVTASSSRRLGVSADLGYQTRNANGTLYDYRNVYAALRTKFTL